MEAPYNIIQEVQSGNTSLKDDGTSLSCKEKSKIGNLGVNVSNIDSAIEEGDSNEISSPKKGGDSNEISSQKDDAASVSYNDENIGLMSFEQLQRKALESSSKADRSSFYNIKCGHLDE